MRATSGMYAESPDLSILSAATNPSFAASTICSSNEPLNVVFNIMYSPNIESSDIRYDA